MASWTRRFQARRLMKQWKKNGYSGEIQMTKTPAGVVVTGPAPRFTSIGLDVLMAADPDGILELTDTHLKICNQLGYLVFGFDPERVALMLYLTYDARKGQGVHE